VPQDPVTRDTKFVYCKGGGFYNTTHDLDPVRVLVARPVDGYKSQGFRTFRPARLGVNP